MTARGKLNDEWGQFTPAQKTRCVSLTGLGGSPSYVELLTCLELAEAAKELPPGNRMTGQGSLRPPRYLIRDQDGIYGVAVSRR